MSCERHENQHRLAAVIVAAGRGLRLGGDMPKQYLDLGGRPMLCRSIEAFAAAGAEKIALVIPAGDEEYVRSEVIEKLRSDCCGLRDSSRSDASDPQESLQKRIVLTPGGKERCDSVYAGLQCVKGADYVWIHDAARPFVDAGVISRCLEAAIDCGAAVPVIPVKDTIYCCEASGSAGSESTGTGCAVTGDAGAGSTGTGCIGEGWMVGALPRASLRAVQTPQTFALLLILEAHERLRGLTTAAGRHALDTAADTHASGAVSDDAHVFAGVTDDAMLVKELLGHEVRLVTGSELNFKVTTAADLERARTVAADLDRAGSDAG